MNKYRVGIIGATGMVGQKFVTLLSNHPWFTVCAVAASKNSAGKYYTEAIKDKWYMNEEIPLNIANLVVFDALLDAAKIAKTVDFVFCAVDLPYEETINLEQMYAKLECPVISNNSSHRNFADVPMVIPEINPEHLEVIPFQRKRLQTKRGFIVTKSNCSLQSYVPPLYALNSFGISKALVCTYQAISGASKTFSTYKEIIDNVIPYIKAEEEKSQNEPLKIWGTVSNGQIINATKPNITAQCIRVPVSDGHLTAVFASFDIKPSIEQIKQSFENYVGEPQLLNLPSAPKRFIHYFEEDDYPQTRLHRLLENGMAISVGRLRNDNQYDIKFVSLSHNTVRGAAGGAILLAELLCVKGYIRS